MTVTWEECGWQGLTPRVGRCRLPGWDCTAGLVVGDGAALLIDAGSSLREGARLRAEACRLLGGARVTHLALTHPHFDHVFGAAAFAGVEVFDAVGVDGVLARDRETLRADAVHHGLPPADATEAADLLVRPRHHVSGEWTLDLGGDLRVLLANVGPGHTGHDLAVLVPGTPDGSREVVFCGDLVEESGEPQAGPDAIPARWPAALDRLLDLGGEDALYVPGHGAVVDATFVRAQRDALARRFGVSG
ncbi:MBL fold metallo-hydrolase [Streptomyces stelliscabiei]|uniref:Glyoxylase-like metal-dependent hydrolase (Beta-lactamase superfamily II) n=1 Tax=Streptomyces stelliscabiei TaxID=146820 RepID=A0A8I0P4W0_9ACTN|nr:MBL fold metallo-hydrolase [Streptomyces stelliscabiei]KND45297.1 metallo-beta-lactamase [Streptomyces stelliscabiei]MBE1597107.1 glyoxylase-like metal-dependent hydrolase (beta-lactamase superfamily II) [Streptomyces stelliscabiei]MDX2513926.1 MBL fold metallo-hydrolase [Streptomyces stelliscabiei]